MSTLKLLLLGGLLAISFVVQAEQLGTGFTYQGQLKQSSAVASGAFDFEFRLFDTDTGGIAIAPSPILAEDISVVDGIFTVELDFGVAPFAGDRLWLEISVRSGTSVGGFTSLLPRQELTAVPYALHTEMVAAGAVGSAEVDPTKVQLRVAESCPAGSSIRVIGQGGTVTCQTDSDAGGDITAVVAGAGLTGGSTTGEATVNVDTAQIQSRINSSCPAGQSIGAINADGTVTCEVDTDTDTNAGTLCPDNTFLNGDGTCDTIPINYPAVSYSGRINTSSSPVFFDEANHQLIVTYVGPNNDYIIKSTTTDTKRVVMDDGTGATVSGIINTVGATLSKNVLYTRIATIDLIETSSNDKLYRYRCMAISTNLVSCTQEIY